MKKSNVKLLLFLALAAASVALIAFMRTRGIGLESLIAERDRMPSWRGTGTSWKN